MITSSKRHVILMIRLVRLFNAKKAQARVKKVGNMVKVNIKNSRTRPVTLF